MTNCSSPATNPPTSLICTLPPVDDGTVAVNVPKGDVRFTSTARSTLPFDTSVVVIAVSLPMSSVALIVMFAACKRVESSASSKTEPSVAETSTRFTARRLLTVILSSATNVIAFAMPVLPEISAEAATEMIPPVASLNGPSNGAVSSSAASALSVIFPSVRTLLLTMMSAPSAVVCTTISPSSPLVKGSPFMIPSKPSTVATVIVVALVR